MQANPNKKLFTFLFCASVFISCDAEDSNIYIERSTSSRGSYLTVSPQVRYQETRDAITRLAGRISVAYQEQRGELSNEELAALEEKSSFLNRSPGDIRISLSSLGTIASISDPFASLPILGDSSGGDDDISSSIVRFIDNNKAMFGLTSPDTELVLDKTKMDNYGRKIFFYQQVTTSGHVVFDRGVVVKVSTSNRLLEINSSIFPTPHFDANLSIIDSGQLATVINNYCQNNCEIAKEPEIGVVAGRLFSFSDDEYYLSWKVVAGDGNADIRTLFVNATDGRVLVEKDPRVYDYPLEAHYYNGSTPGELVYRTSPYYMHSLPFPGHSWDILVFNIDTANYYESRYNRNGWDDGKYGSGPVNDFGTLDSHIYCRSSRLASATREGV